MEWSYKYWLKPTLAKYIGNVLCNSAVRGKICTMAQKDQYEQMQYIFAVKEK